jgi:hypothetical protein
MVMVYLIVGKKSRRGQLTPSACCCAVADYLSVFIGQVLKPSNE